MFPLVSESPILGLVGTWLFDVPETEGGTPAFQSLMTFHEGGTLTEVNAELGPGFQGPAQGVWEKHGKQYVATFQTWVFNGDTGVVEGRVQIRARFEKTSRNSFEGWTVIDFIELPGCGRRIAGKSVWYWQPEHHRVTRRSGSDL